MECTKAIIEGVLFYCYSLLQVDQRDIDDIIAFEPVNKKGMGLVRYLQLDAARDEIDGLMRTYLVRARETDELVGYFSLKAGLVTTDEMINEGVVSFDTEPGVELANFAVNGIYRSAHPDSRGCGVAIFNELIMPMVYKAARHVGVSVVYLYALPEKQVVLRYQKYGFSKLDPAAEQQLHSRLKPRYDADCIFMMQRLR